MSFLRCLRGLSSKTIRFLYGRLKQASSWAGIVGWIVAYDTHSRLLQCGLVISGFLAIVINEGWEAKREAKNAQLMVSGLAYAIGRDANKSDCE
jgi:hypothetical protein